MSVEDRLLLLLAQVRETGGDAAFRDMSVLRSRLSSRAPDLHGEIQALAAALARGVPRRIAAAQDPAAERAAAAAEIAQQEKLPIAVVTPALEVACRAGIDIAPPLEVARDDAWAGDSMVVGGGAGPAPGGEAGAPSGGAGFAAPPPHVPPHLAPQAPSQPPMPAPAPFGGHQGFAPPAGPQGYGGEHYAPPHDYEGYGDGYDQPQHQPFYTKVWFFILLGALIVGGAILYTQWNHLFGRRPVAAGNPANPPAPPNTQQPERPPAPPPAESLFTPGGPVLTEEGDGVPMQMQQAPDGRRGVTFSMVIEGNRIDAALVLPAAGWEGEATLVGTAADGSRSVGTGRFVLSSPDRPVRLMRVQWRQDGLEAGAAAIAIVGAPGQSDVPFSGADLCVMDGTTGEPLACGPIQ